MKQSGSKTQYYQKWEVCVTAKDDINGYVGYVRAQFFEEQRQFVVVRARGLAIENALKVVQLVKENIGDIHSQTRLYLMTDKAKSNSVGERLNPEHDASCKRIVDEEIGHYEKFCSEKYLQKSLVLPAVEVILSRHPVDLNNPGYQKPAIRVHTIFHGEGILYLPKNMGGKTGKIIRKRNLNHEFLLASEDSGSTASDKENFPSAAQAS